MKISMETIIGGIVFEVQGNTATQMDGSGMHVKEFENFNEAMHWVLDSVRVVLSDMNGVFVES